MTDEDDTARVRAYEADKDAINERRQGTETQADVIRRLLDGEGDTDTDTDTGESLEVVSTEALTDGLMDDFDTDSRDGASYDDIKAACAAAIRDELGEVLDR